jgi:integrase
MAIEVVLNKSGITSFRARFNSKNHRLTKTFPIRLDAQNWLVKMQSDIEDGNLPSEEISLKKAIHQFLDSAHAENMCRVQRRRIEFFASPAFKHSTLDVSELRPDHFLCLYNLFESRKYAVATCNRYKSAFSTIWKWLSTQRGVKNNDGRYLILRLCSNESPMGFMNWGKEPITHTRYLKKEDLPKLLDGAKFCDYPYFQTLIITLVLTAQRIGSVRQLLWEDIDFNTGTIRFIGDKQKNKKGQLKQVPNELMQVLKKHKLAMVNSPYIFPSVTDNDKPLVTYTKYWKKTIEAANLGYKLTPHNLRSGVATWLALDGHSVEDIAEMLNHKTRTMALRYIKVNELKSNVGANLSTGMDLSNYG